MSTAQWTLSIVLLVWVLGRNLGVRTVTRSMFAVPLAIVTVAAVAMLRDVPIAGNDLSLELIGTAVGLALGVLAAASCRLENHEGRPAVRAGLGFAALWVLVIGGRVVFAAWAEGPGSATIARFSRDHLITGADAWTVAFVLLSLAMVAARLVVLGTQLTLTHRTNTVTSEVRS
jgi:hypothetical protein